MTGSFESVHVLHEKKKQLQVNKSAPGKSAIRSQLQRRRLDDVSDINQMEHQTAQVRSLISDGDQVACAILVLPEDNPF